MNIDAPTLPECIAYLRDGGNTYERERRANTRPMSEAERRRVEMAVVCGESEDRRWARACGSVMEARERMGEL